MKHLKRIPAIVGVAVLLTNCTAPKSDEKTNTKEDILRAHIDTTIDPGVDFFSYANGAWIKQNPIPSTESRWGIANLVTEEINAKLRKINEDAAAMSNAAKGSSEQIIGDIYAAAMDTVNIEKTGLGGIQPELQAIQQIKSSKDISSVLQQFQSIGVSPFFELYSGQDEKNSDIVLLRTYQGGLGMSGREYYLDEDARTTKIRNEYLLHIEKNLVFLGVNPESAKKEAKEILVFETQLAKKSRTLEDLRDPYANYNKFSLDHLSKKYPTINWLLLSEKAGLKTTDSIIVGQPEFLAEVNMLLNKTPLTVLKNYLQLNLLNAFASHLNKAIADENFHFFGTIMYDVKAQKPRWKKIIEFENRNVGEILGQQFVKEVFPEKSKQRYETMVKLMLETYAEHIQKLDWMSDATKQKALTKLNTIVPKVGYPNKWKDFSKVEVSRTSAVRNAINLNNWWYNYYMAKVGKPVDRTEWEMPPQEYNAYYNPSSNEIVLPAAQLMVPGYADDELDDALVYGYSAASTIGHELTHGFDDEGRQFNEKGELKNWWTKEDEDKFNAKAKLYIQQFNDYIVLDSMHVRGLATLGENIADLGGIVIGLDAFKKTEQYKKGEKIAGLSPVQRFFLGYSLGWLGHQTNAKLANQILTNVHAPSNLRVNGPFSNIPEFYEAFGVKQGQAMWRNDSIRVKIW